MPKRNYPTSKPRKATFRFFALGFAAFSTLCALGASLFSGASSVRADAADEWVSEKETIIPREELAVTATSSALTDDSQSVTVTFTSKKVEAYPNSSQVKNVYVTPIDPTFDIKTVTDEARAAREEQGEEFVMPEYECSVYNICYNPNGGSTKNTVVIPDTLIYSNLIVFRVTTIGSDVVFNPDGGDAYGQINKIVIPEHVTTIEAKAFMGVPETVQIYCEADALNEEGKPTYPEDWTDATVEYGYALTSQEQSLLSRTAGSKKEFGEGADFFLGMDSEEFDLPLYFEYQLEKINDDGSVTPVEGAHYQALEVQSSNNDYDAVGSNMGVSSITSYVNVAIPKGHRINSDTLVFHNIYRAVAEKNEEGAYTGRFVPDFEIGPCLSYPLVTYDFVPHFSDFFTMTPVSVATMGQFLQFEAQFERVAWPNEFGIYSILQPTVYNTNEANLRNGTLEVRYQFSALDQASYRFTLKNGTQIEARVRTPIAYILIPKRAYRVGFLLDVSSYEGLNYADIATIELLGFSVKADLYKPSTNSIVTKSAYTVRFGSLALFPNVPETKHIEMPMVIALTYVVYVVAFVAGAIGYYFYAKRRYRNDEFRRVDNKRYFIAAAKNFVGFAFVLSALLFIYARWGLMRTTLVTYNPLDAFVAAFSVVALVFLGFTIKNIVVSVKNARKRKEALRLKLDQDQDDDGTK